MKKVLLVAALVALSGCATKNYGRQGQVTDYEKQSLTCREIDIEKAKTEGFIQHVNKEAEFSGRDVLAILGDFGIGNSLERDAALKSAQDRKDSLTALRAQKQCS